MLLGSYTWVLGLALLFVYVLAVHVRAAGLVERKQVEAKIARQILLVVTGIASALGFFIVLAQISYDGPNALCAYYGSPLNVVAVMPIAITLGVLVASLMIALLPQAAPLMASLWSIVVVTRPIERNVSTRRARWLLAGWSLVIGMILTTVLTIAIMAPEQFPC